MEQIYGSSLESMASAVENASVFLMCVSEKYYLSPNCRLEAEYAVKLQKPIVPLIMQSNYMPLGWLGIIIAGKIYYSFTDIKQSFDQTFSNMNKEISRHVSDEFPSTKVNAKPRLNSSVSKTNSKIENNFVNSTSSLSTLSTSEPNSFRSNKSKVVSEWSHRDVKNWIGSLGLSNSM